MTGILRVAALAITLSAAARTPALATDSPTLAVKVIDYAHAASGVLIEAEHHVTRVFGVAGVNVAWREGEAALPPNVAAQVTVLILSDGMAARKIATEHLSTGVLATAAPAPGRRAWLFFRRVAEAAELQRRSTGLALGHVIAHEIAHMVATVGHSDGSLMASSFHLTDALQGFTREQGERIRAAVQVNSAAIMLDVRDRSRTFRPSGAASR
jgi:hypothetical protein